MRTPDDPGLDPQRVERIRAKALARGAQIRRRSRVVRRSAILAGLAVLAGGSIAIAAARVAPTGQRHQQAIGPSSTTTTVPFTSTTQGPATTTTGPRLGTTTTTTIPFGTTTSSISPTTIPPTTTTSTTTTIPPPPPRPFSKTLTDVVAAGTLKSEQWTVPSSETAQIGELTIADTGAGANGELRVQLTQPGESPQTLVGVSLGEVASPLDASLTTDLVVLPGESFVLTVACDPDQPACAAKVSVSGQLWQQGQAPAGDESSSLVDVVAPGESGSASWTVPAGDTFSLTDLLVSALGPVDGEVRLQILRAGSPPRDIVSYRLATLGRRPVHDALSPAVTLAAGEQLSLTVSCDPNQSACDTATLFTGTLSPTG